ncbi:MAG: hypothetical protein ABF567_02840 [Acetobacter okinawensis]
MIDQPTGVFVRLPLSEEQVESVLNSYTGDKESTNVCMQKTILDLGTPVTGGDLKPIAYVNAERLKWKVATNNDVCLSFSGQPLTGGGTLNLIDGIILFSDAQAALVERYRAGWAAGKRDAHLSYTRQIAALEAEVVRLREAIHKIIDMSRNAQTWSLNNRAASCREELSAIGRLGEKTLKGGAA